MDIIAEIKNNVIEYNTNYLYKNIGLLTELLSGILQKLNKNDVKEFENIIKHICISLENKDYYLLIDILQYEVVPYLEKVA